MSAQPRPPWDPDPRFVQPPEPLADDLGTPWAGWILVAAFGTMGILLGLALPPGAAVLGLSFLVGLAFVLARLDR